MLSLGVPRKDPQKGKTKEEEKRLKAQRVQLFNNAMNMKESLTGITEKRVVFC